MIGVAEAERPGAELRHPRQQAAVIGGVKIVRVAPRAGAVPLDRIAREEDSLRFPVIRHMARCVAGHMDNGQPEPPPEFDALPIREHGIHPRRFARVVPDVAGALGNRFARILQDAQRCAVKFHLNLIGGRHR